MATQDKAANNPPGIHGHARRNSFWSLVLIWFLAILVLGTSYEYNLSPCMSLRLRTPSVTQFIFIGMAIGLIIGWFWPDVAVTLRPLSVIFLRLIKSII